MSAAALVRTFSFGKLTQTAGTLINQLIPPVSSLRTKVTKVCVTTGATAHVLTALRPLGKTTVASAAAAAQAVVNITANPGNYPATWSTADNNIAANDIVAIRKPDGTFFLTTVASVSTLAITMNDNVPTGGLEAGADVFFYGIKTDTNPYTGLAHPTFNLPADGLNILGDGENSLVESCHVNEPILLQIDNGTNASVIENISGVYGP